MYECGQLSLIWKWVFLESLGLSGCNLGPRIAFILPLSLDDLYRDPCRDPFPDPFHDPFRDLCHDLFYHDLDRDHAHGRGLGHGPDPANTTICIFIKRTILFFIGKNMINHTLLSRLDDDEYVFVRSLDELLDLELGELDDLRAELELELELRCLWWLLLLLLLLPLLLLPLPPLLLFGLDTFECFGKL